VSTERNLGSEGVVGSYPVVARILGGSNVRYAEAGRALTALGCQLLLLGVQVL